MAKKTNELNLIKNPRLADGAQTPRGWRWIGADEAVAWSREPGDNGQGPVMTLHSDKADSTAGWARRVRCKADEHYRIELVASGEVCGEQDASGLVLSIQPLEGGEPVDQPCELIAPHKLGELTRLRAYYHSPDDVRSVEVQVGLARAKGVARIHEIMMFEILEPEAQSHVLACPPPPYAYPPPKRVRSVCVCTRSDTDVPRPIVELLRRRFGKTKVNAVQPEQFGSGCLDADALLFPDVLPRSAANLPALEKLAADRMVVVSLPTFAAMAGPAFNVRTIKQQDDPIHAKVREANFMTRGFAIADIFPYAWRGPDPREFVQRHFRRGMALREYCRRHGFEIVMLSVCNTDASTDCPMCLYKPTEAGGIVVLDIEPAEDTPTNFDEPDLAFYLLCNVMGAAQNTMGQFVCPAPSEPELRREVGELGDRYAALTVRGCDHPDKPRLDQLVEVGGVGDDVVVPLVPRPVILIRSGLRGDDTDGVYGAMFWLKDLARHEPYVNPYAGELIRRFRLAWIPLCAEWHEGQGWAQPEDAAQLPIAAEFDPESLAAVIDITSTARRGVRVVVSNEDVRQRWANLLPGMADQCLHNRFFYRSVPIGHEIADRAAMDWRFQKLVPAVTSDTSGELESEFHKEATSAGATLVRLEFPGPAADLSCGSIWRTDLVAQTLDQVVGLLHGWIAMNRNEKPLRLTAPDLPPGTQALRIRMRGSEPETVQQNVTPGKPISLPTGTALCVANPQPQCPDTTMESPCLR